MGFFLLLLFVLFVCFSFRMTRVIHNKAHFPFKVLIRLFYQWFSFFNSISKCSQCALKNQTKQIVAACCSQSIFTFIQL